MQWTQVDCPWKNVKITSGKRDVLFATNKDTSCDLVVNALNRPNPHPLNLNWRRLQTPLMPMHTWDPSITISQISRNKDCTNASKKRVFDKADCTGNSPCYAFHLTFACNCSGEWKIVYYPAMSDRRWKECWPRLYFENSYRLWSSREIHWQETGLEERDSPY